MSTAPAVAGVERTVVSVLRVGVPAAIVAVYLWRIVGLQPVHRFSDDFFYYLVPARNWLDGLGAVFLPGEPTNGYHPLWFGWLTLLHSVAGDGTVFFALVDLSLMALLIGFFAFFQRFLARVTADPLAAAVGATIATVALTVIASAGLETALTVFTAAVLLDFLSRKPLAENTTGDAAVVGLLSAALVLARLDAVLLAPGLMVAVLGRWDWRRLTAFLIGAAPLYAYLAFNLAMFGHWSTTSMAAKSLALYWPPNWYFATEPSPVVPVIVVTVAVSVAILARHIGDRDRRWLALALAAAPVLQLASQALLSGWMLFRWYFYFFFMALGLLAALLVVMLRRRSALRRVGVPLGVGMLVATPVALIVAVQPDPWQVEIATTAEEVRAFASAHPGVYAMGDGAGTPGWLLDQPLVHLEGLMMSHDFIGRIEQKQPLQRVFRDYQVDYYVAVWTNGRTAQGCLKFAEPNPEQASDRAPHLAATICSDPVKVIEPGPRYTVRIYRIDSATGRPTADMTSRTGH
ncbi:hypothetical protein [Mycolicibacterium thermoresistibile]